MKKIFLMLIFCLPVGLYAHELDSLQKVLNTHKNLSRKKLFSTYLQLSDVYLGVNNKAALNYAQRALEIADKTMKSSDLSAANIALGDALAYSGQNRLALSYFKVAHDIAIEEQDKTTIIKSLTGLGRASMMLDYTDMSLRYFLEILEIEQDEEEIVKTGVNMWLAKLYTAKKDFKKAVFYLEKDLKVSQKYHRLRASTLSEIGNVYYHQGNYERALSYYQRGYQEALNEKNKNALGFCSNNIALVLYRQGQYEKAETVFREAIQYFEQSDSQRDIANVLSNLAQLYAAQQKYEQAIRFAEQGYQKAQNLHDYPLLIELSEVMIDIYKNINEPEKYSTYQENRVAYRDTINLQKKESELLAFKIQQDLLENKEQVEALNAYNERLKYAILLTILGLIALSVISFLAFKANQLKKKVIAQHQIILKDLEEKAALETELQQVRNDLLEENNAQQARQLAGQAMLLVQKNEWLSDIEKQIKANLGLLENEQKHIVKQIFSDIQSSLQLENDWEQYKIHFEEVHPRFFELLKSLYPRMSQNDLRMAAYLKINLSNKELAQMLNVTEGSLRVNLSRLKQKLELDKSQDLRAFLQSEL